MKQLIDVGVFQTMLGLEYDGPPRHMPDELVDLRRELLKEELREYLIALTSGSLSDQFDALIDLVYVALGNAYLHGFPFAEGWDAVHAANMLKRAGKSKRGLAFDAAKPEGWTPPDLETILETADELATRRAAQRAARREPRDELFWGEGTDRPRGGGASGGDGATEGVRSSAPELLEDQGPLERGSEGSAEA